MGTVVCLPFCAGTLLWKHEAIYLYEITHGTGWCGYDWRGTALGVQARQRGAGDTEPFGSLSETYTHPELGFSFRYPHGFRVSEIPQEEEVETVLVEDPAHARQGFQVFTQRKPRHNFCYASGEFS
jgi:hypothetical protein